MAFSSFSSIQPVLGMSLWLGREYAVKCINTELEGSGMERDHFLAPNCQKQGLISMLTSGTCRFASPWTAPWSRFGDPHVLSQPKWARWCQQLTRIAKDNKTLPLYGCFLPLDVPVLGKMGRKHTCSKAEQSQNSSAAYSTKEEGVTHKNYTL